MEKNIMIGKDIVTVQQEYAFAADSVRKWQGYDIEMRDKE